MFSFLFLVLLERSLPLAAVSLSCILFSCELGASVTSVGRGREYYRKLAYREVKYKIFVTQSCKPWKLKLVPNTTATILTRTLNRESS